MFTPLKEHINNISKNKGEWTTVRENVFVAQSCLTLNLK